MPSLIHLPVALLLCYPLAHAEAATNKCTNGKQITYANVPCEEMGLKSVGPVKSVVTVIPATPATTGKGNNAPAYKTPPEETAENQPYKGPTIKPVSPLVGELLD